MNFRIRRTSDFLSEEKPCEGAEFLKRSMHDGDKKFWVIEINTLDDLLKLRDLVGEDLILTWSYEDDELGEMRELEIYDTYRE